MNASPLIQCIQDERTARETQVTQDLLPLILQGDVQQAIELLLFYLAPRESDKRARTLLAQLHQDFERMTESGQAEALRFAVEFAKSLWSFLPRWNLQAATRWGEAALSPAELDSLAEAAANAASRWSTIATSAAARLHQEVLADTERRLKAEAVKAPADEAQAFVGNSLDVYLANFRRAVTTSNLRRIAELRHSGALATEISNDYAAFFPWAFFLGASFITCNPPLVDLAWVADPASWNPLIDRILGEDLEADADVLARRVTLEIVLANMRLLRPVFLLTDGRMGCVSLQVNPRRHDDPQAMIADSLSIYDDLTQRLMGGVPNVVFKLPGTHAGLQACRELTRRGIGVTITVNFGLFQHLPFAEAIRDGTALFCTLAHMSGRLAFPVRDELLGKMDELARLDIDEGRLRRAAAWSGVIVLRKLHRLLHQRAIPLDRVRPLIASLRVYEGPLHAGLPSPMPDITEVVGTRIITVFPNVRRIFDAAPALDLRPGAIDEPPPDEALEVLRHSEIFRQAYYAGEGAPDPDDEAFRPSHPLRLEDEAGTFAWVPVHNTLTEFIQAYDAFVRRIEGRRRILRLRAWRSGGAPLAAQEIAFALTDPFAPTLHDAWHLLDEMAPAPAIDAALRSPAVRTLLEENADDAFRQLTSRVLDRHAPSPRGGA
jgi:hypothetical protein